MSNDDSMDLLRRTPLYDAHVRAGAKVVPFAGWEMPVQYTGVLAEVNAVRTGVGLFDVSHMGRIELHGNHAREFLQATCPSDIFTVPIGGAQYSLLLNERGGVIDDIIVYRLTDHEWVVVLNASNADKDIAWLKSRLPSGVSLRDTTSETGLIAVQGPDAVLMLDKLSDADLTAVDRFGIIETAVADIWAIAARTGYTGEDGFELFCRADDAAALWDRLVAAGGVPCGLGARDTLRVEAALPLYGHEMDENTQPFAARLGWVVKRDKVGGFVGKTALDALGDTLRAKSLVGLEMDGRAIPRDGYSVFAVGGTDAIGHVTSGTFSPMKGKGIAMARLNASAGKRGTLVEVEIRGQRHAARVVALPFYKNV